MQNRRLKSPIVFSIALALILGFTGGAFAERQTLFLNGSIPPGAAQNFRLMADAWNLIQKQYVDRSAIQSTSMTYGAISGMVNALGDTGHSAFLSPEMLKEEQNFTQGQFEGIGVEIQVKDGNVVIIAPIDGSPAQRAGLHTGDIILGVNGANISGLPLEQVVSRVLGPAGSTVTLTIKDARTGRTSDLVIQRAQINIHNVTWHMLPGTSIAHLRIEGFSQGITLDLQKAIQDIRAQGGTGIVLDLRNNPGGLLGEAVDVASQFLTRGNVLLEKNAQGEETAIPVEPGGKASDIPMALLINQGTASASEIVSGALQDAHRATLVGETTFGTGTALDKFPLSDGSALMLATEEWLTPKGHSIWHHGISPDVNIPLRSDSTPLVPEAEQDMTLNQLRESGDAQLLYGLDLLLKSSGNSG